MSVCLRQIYPSVLNKLSNIMEHAGKFQVHQMGMEIIKVPGQVPEHRFPDYR